MRPASGPVVGPFGYSLGRWGAPLGSARTAFVLFGEVPIKRPASKGGDRTLINDDIRESTVRLIGAEGEQIGIVSRDDALREARKATLDLVLISPDAKPPVCKIMDFGKHLFELKKQKSAQKKKQKQIQIKEMKFRPGTEEGDYQVKLRNLIRFLGDGDKAKVSLRFRGREMVHPEIGMQLMKRIEVDLEEHGVVEAMPRFEGRQVTMVLAPKKKKK
jgi:translation initiation factor IF-3